MASGWIREVTVHDKALRIYLNDHLAGATTGAELSRRIARAHDSSGRAPELRRLAEDIADDRRSLLALMESLGIAPQQYKARGGWLAEKIARLKLNGRVRRRSGLSTIVELETLRMGIQGKYLLWTALMAAAPVPGPVDTTRLQELADRAKGQMETVEALHRTAAGAVLGEGRI
ncbi:hypothetical protein [Streptomyces sp. NPDC055709]